MKDYIIKRLTLNTKCNNNCLYCNKKHHYDKSFSEIKKELDEIIIFRHNDPGTHDKFTRTKDSYIQSFFFEKTFKSYTFLKEGPYRWIEQTAWDVLISNYYSTLGKKKNQKISPLDNDYRIFSLAGKKTNFVCFHFVSPVRHGLFDFGIIYLEKLNFLDKFNTINDLHYNN